MLMILKLKASYISFFSTKLIYIDYICLISMIEVKAKTKKWENSIGVVIPKEVVREENIKPNQQVTLMINAKPFTTGKDIFGTLNFNKSTEKLMREVDKDFDLGF